MLLKAWGEFIVAGTDTEMRINSEHKFELVLEQERSKSKPALPWTRGEVEMLEKPKNFTDGLQARIVFNEQLLGWHYNWMSSKNTCDSYHTFFIRFFYKDGETSKLFYVGSASSPRFQLFSRHRIRVLQKANGRSKEEIISKDLRTSDEPAPPLKSKPAKRKEAIRNEYEHDMLLHQLRAGEPPSAFSKAEKSAFRRKLNMIIDHNKPLKKRLRNLHDYQRHDNRLLEINASTADVKTEKDEFHLALEDKNVYTTITRLITFLLFFADGGSNQPRSSSRQGSFYMNSGKATNSQDALEEFSASLLQDILGTILPNEFFDCGHDQQAFRDEAAQINDKQDGKHDAFTGFDALRQAVLEMGSESAKDNIDIVIQSIEDLANDFLYEQELSEKVSQLFRKWSAKSESTNVNQKQCRAIKAKSLAKHMDMKDFETLKEMMETGKAETFSGEVKLVIFKHALKFMKEKNLEFDFFCESMEIAAKSGILPFDFHVPPRPVIAEFIHIQVNGDATKIRKEDFGSKSGRFQSIEQKVAWRRALQSFLLSMFRFAVLARIKQERRFSRLPTPATPVPKEMDFSDTWIRAIEDADRNMFLFSEMVRKLSGVHFGSFYGKLMDSMFQRVDISLSKEAILLQGEKKLFTSSSFLFYLDGKPHAFSMPQPVPFPGHTGKQWVCSWISKKGDSAKFSVKIVGGGPVTPAPSSEFTLKLRQDNKETLGKSPFSKEALEVRMVGEITLSSDSSMLLVDTSMHIFATDSAPPFSSIAEMERLFSSQASSIVSRQRLRFLRYFNFDFSP